MRRRLACLLLVFLAPLCLAACGDKSPATDTTAQAQGESNGSRFKGGEKSIEEFGSEADGSEREAILSAERAYLTALGVRGYAVACSHLATAVRGSLRRLAPKQLSAEGCPAILPLLLSPSASATARRQADGKIAKVRAKGDRAFVVFHAPGAELYLFTMAREGGAWKLTTVAASVLVPSQAVAQNH